MSEVRKWDDGLDVPIMVSVTGHVDLVDEEVPGIREKVRRFLENLRREYPNTRVIVMSALARGADLLVSEEALDMNIHVAPVLPMPMDEYRCSSQIRCCPVEPAHVHALSSGDGVDR